MRRDPFRASAMIIAFLPSRARLDRRGWFTHLIDHHHPWTRQVAGHL